MDHIVSGLFFDVIACQGQYLDDLIHKNEKNIPKINTKIPV